MECFFFFFLSLGNKHELDFYASFILSWNWGIGLFVFVFSFVFCMPKDSRQGGGHIIRGKLEWRSVESTSNGLERWFSS